MTTTAGVGNSRHPDPRLAGEHAMRAALQDLRDRSSDAPLALALAFATTGYDQQALVDALLDTLRDAVEDQDVPLVGCSVEGTITSEGSCEDACSVAVMLIASPSLEVRAQRFALSRSHERLAGEFAEWLEALGDGAVHEPRPGELVLFLADGLDTNVADVFDVLDHERIAHIPIVGGLAGDPMAFRHTFVYFDGGACEHIAVAVHLRGQFVAEFGVAHGCEPVGLPMRVTASDGHELVELDGRAAWDVVREYLHLDSFDGLSSSLLSLSFRRDDHTAPIIRSPFALAPDRGALRFTGTIPDGAQVNLTRRNTRTIRKSAEQCAREIRDRHPDRVPALVIQLDCAHRGRIVLGSATSLILVSAVRCILGTSVPWIGGHTFAEIAPVDGRVCFHNFSVVLLALYDL